jgi:hypothetical protein
MRLGVRIRALAQHRLGVLVSALIALAAALLSVFSISLTPPGLTPRSLDIAAASTQVLLDTPHSLIVDVRQDAAVLESFTDRAVLLGNVMAREPVRAYVAERAGVPVEALIVEAPLTPSQPRARRVDPGDQAKVGDVLASSDQYRLSIQADPTVPLLDVYAQAPSAAAAEAIANAAVDGLSSYVDEVATAGATPSREKLQLVQLGRARGELINGGADLQVAFVVFLLTFAVCCALVLFLDRVKQGWRLAALSEQPAVD